jgi:hypothetical protein
MSQELIMEQDKIKSLTERVRAYVFSFKPSVLNCQLLVQPMLLLSWFPIHKEHLDAVMMQ